MNAGEIPRNKTCFARRFLLAFLLMTTNFMHKNHVRIYFGIINFAIWANPDDEKFQTALNVIVRKIVKKVSLLIVWNFQAAAAIL